MRERKYRIRYHQESQGSIPEQIIERIYSFNDLLNYGKPHKIEKIISVDDWTGLKDKNGKEIYEGDIINCQVYQREEYDEYLSESPIKVVFENGCFYPFSYKFAWRSSVDDIEVIGNIHENKELLK